MKRKEKNEELVNNSNQPQQKDLMNNINKIDDFLFERLSDWIWDELKYFRKDSNECNEIQCDLICNGNYYEISPLIKYFNGYVNKK
jgi:hypothetical protein